MSRQIDQFTEFLSRNKNQSSEQSHREAVKMAEKVEKQKKAER